MVLAFNLNGMMKTQVAPEEFRAKRLKSLRFHIIGVAGRLVRHARGLAIKLSGGAAVVERFEYMRGRIAILAQAPPPI